MQKLVENLRPGSIPVFLLAACLALASQALKAERDDWRQDKGSGSQSSLGQSPKAQYDDPDDPCQPVRKRLTVVQDHFAADMFGAVLTGAGVGGLAGALAGIITGDLDVEKVVVGAAVGGLAAGVNKYLAAKQQQAQNRADLRRAISFDVHRDSGQVTRMSSILRRLNECRQSQVAEVERDFRSGRMTREQARVQLASVRQSVQRDNALVADILGDVETRNAVYVKSIASVEGETEAAVLGQAATYTPRVYTHRVSTITRYFAQTSSNVRAKPSTSAPVVGGLSTNAPVDVVGPVADGRWFEIRFDGRQAYVFAELLGTRTAVSESVVPPTVEQSARPQTTNEVQELVASTREIYPVYEQDVAGIDRKIGRLETMLL